MEFKVGDIVKFKDCEKSRSMGIVGCKGKIISIRECNNNNPDSGCVECGHKFKTIDWFDEIIKRKFSEGQDCFGYNDDYIIEKANPSTLKEFIKNGI